MLIAPDSPRKPPVGTISSDGNPLLKELEILRKMCFVDLSPLSVRKWQADKIYKLLPCQATHELKEALEHYVLPEKLKKLMANVVVINEPVK